MTDFQVYTGQTETAFLVGVHIRGSDPLLSTTESLSELERLADTAGMEVVGQAIQNLSKINPATFIGTGKVQEIYDEILELGANVVIFDDELSPRHQRELEKTFKEDIKVLDRSALILDIFAQHAHTREGALQVELAQYEYRLPRLTRMWTHLARQAGGGGARGGSGGVGLRGPGETQLEVDRREISRKITYLKKEIEKVRTHRQQYRNKRQKSDIPTVTLVGYTNAGKSTLLNALTESDVYVADQLFATLDPTTRRVTLPSGRATLFSDTVGFIQKLPPTLIAAFRATLDEIADADLLLHMVDASHPNALEHIESVEDTLAQLDISDVPTLLVLNKVDLIADAEDQQLQMNADEYIDVVEVSASKKIGLERLLIAVDEGVSASDIFVDLLIPYDEGQLVSQLFEVAKVERQDHTENGVRIQAQVPQNSLASFQSYRVEM